jgi:Domain of Unknown Function (DUF1080).
MRNSVLLGWLLLAIPLGAAERRFDFGQTTGGQVPAGFQSVVSGQGKPGDWRVMLEDVAPAIAPLSPQAPSVAKRAVLAQLAQDPADEHFPILIFNDETFGDFTFTTRFKAVSGRVEQMAGIVFRYQNESNYYVLRASSLGNTFRFYKVVNGQRGSIIGPEVRIPANEWHELSVECKGNQIRCLLDGKESIPSLSDSSFINGKVGFWTKSDSVSYFTDARIVYVPREIEAEVIVRDLLKKYPRLDDIRIYTAGAEKGSSRLVASRDQKGVGESGTKAEWDIIQRGVIYYAKEKGIVTVTMPVRDRNGDSLAAVRVVMKSFPGQTEQNAVARATPILKEIQAGGQAGDDLTAAP